MMLTKVKASVADMQSKIDLLEAIENRSVKEDSELFDLKLRIRQLRIAVEVLEKRFRKFGY